MARITYATAVVLEAIADGRRYGFDIMEATGLPSGTIYPALRRLERDGRLESAWEDEAEATADQRPARRYYTLADAGHELLAEARARYHGLARSLPGEAADKP